MTPAFRPLLRYTLFAIVLLLAMPSLQAQQSGESSKLSKLGYGFKVNGSIPVLSKSANDSVRAIAMPGAGLFVSYNVDPVFRPQLELEYSNIAFEKSLANRTNKAYVDLGFNLYIKPGAKSNINLILGSQLSFTQGMTIRQLSNASAGGTAKTYVNSENGRIDHLVTGGFTIPASKRVDIHAKYYHSLTCVTSQANILGKTSYVQFGVTVNLHRFTDETRQSIPKAETEQTERDYRTLIDSGAVFVRLSYPTNTLDMLTADNKFYEAKDLYNSAHARNAEIVQAFRKYFTFAPVYFFVDSNTTRLLNNDWNGIFVNDKLEPDSSIRPANKRFLVIEFGLLHRKATGMMIDNELVVLNSRMQQMDEPFPYRVPPNLEAVGPVNDSKLVFINKYERSVYLENLTIRKFYKDYFGYVK